MLGSALKGVSVGQTLANRNSKSDGAYFLIFKKKNFFAFNLSNFLKTLGIVWRTPDVSGVKSAFFDKKVLEAARTTFFLGIVLFLGQKNYALLTLFI